MNSFLTIIVCPSMQICSKKERKMQNNQGKVHFLPACRYYFYYSYMIFRQRDHISIKPMDRTEVYVIVKGLNLNTPDILVMEYLGKHGKVVSDKVVYDTDKDGPFKCIP